MFKNLNVLGKGMKPIFIEFRAIAKYHGENTFYLEHDGWVKMEWVSKHLLNNSPPHLPTM